MVIDITADIYFAPLLPWQVSLWKQLTTRVLTPPHHLPHALLAAGMQGMGKRAFVWRFVAWLLCRQQAAYPLGACGQCESCQWLKSGTHPSLQVLPLASMPINHEKHDDSMAVSGKKTKSNNKSAKASSNASMSTKVTIKIDDIRALQPFIYQGGMGMRICVLDHAEQMTIAAANALLKTLEEPQSKVHLFLLSDRPAKLLPTIKSRVQQLPLQNIDASSALEYVQQKLGSTIQREAVSSNQIAQLLRLANGAPLAAVSLAQADWYSKRSLWLKTWQALRSGKRSSLAASDYWQEQLNLIEFLELTELMLVDILRVTTGFDNIQKDVDLLKNIESSMPLDVDLQRINDSIQQIKVSLNQNVQEKFAYDKLMQELATL